MSRRKSVCFAAGLCLLLAGPHWAAGGGDENGRHQFRIVASTNLVGEVNMNDARAALRSWSDAILKQTGMEVGYDAAPLTNSEQLFEEVRRGTVDAFAITLLEYIQVAPWVDTNSLLVDGAYSQGGLEYVLLAHEESGIKNLSDLRGRQLVVTNNADMCLAPAWLETLLAASNLGPADGFFRGVINASKLSQAVLPVYFRQKDACLVTGRGFALMCEMNPQLSKKLRVISVSPKLVPVLFAFHKDCPVELKVKLRKVFLGLPATPVGKQLLTLFQSQGISEANMSVVKASVEMVKAYQRIKARSR